MSVDTIQLMKNVDIFIVRSIHGHGKEMDQNVEKVKDRMRNQPW
jgi:hypothetical protein